MKDKRNRKKPVPVGWWLIKEHRVEAAKKCITTTQYCSEYGRAYRISCECGELHEFTWLNPRKPKNYWKIFEHRKDAAKSCKSAGEYARTFRRAYEISKSIPGEMELFFGDYNKIKYTEEFCRNEVSKYDTLDQLRNENNSLYVTIHTKKWYHLLKNLKRKINPYKNKKTCVYAYFFNEINSVYVGLTTNLKRRDREHRGLSSYYKGHSSVFKFSNDNNIEIPKVTLLESGLSLQEASDKEIFYTEKFSSEGWVLINKVRAGNIGATASRKWSYNKFIKEAKKYKTLKDFRISSESCYNTGLANGWIKDCMWLERAIHNDYTLEEILEAANKCETIKEFRNKYYNFYIVAHRHRDDGWFEKLNFLKRSRATNKLSDDNIWDAARKCTSKMDFKNRFNREYNHACKRKMLHLFTWFQTPPSSQRRKVNQYDLTGNLVRSYDSLMEAGKINNISFKNIQACCKGKVKTCMEFIWKYADEVENNLTPIQKSI